MELLLGTAHAVPIIAEAVQRAGTCMALSHLQWVAVRQDPHFPLCYPLPGCASENTAAKTIGSQWQRIREDMSLCFIYLLLLQTSLFEL